MRILHYRIEKKVSIGGKDMEKGLISIVLPIYNLENYIEKAVQSILNQTYKNIEIILVDDGSSDRTAELIKKFSEKYSNIKAFYQKNAGVTSARLNGVLQASGEWIGFVDGDDYIDSDMYERLLLNAQKYNVQISHCGYKMVFPSRIDYYYNSGRVIEQDKITGLKDLVAGYFIEPGLCNKLFRTELFHSLTEENLMDYSIKNMEDLLMNYYLFREADRIIYEDFCPYNYMIRNNSAATSRINVHKLEDPLRVFRKLEMETKGELILQNEIKRRLAAILISHATMPFHGQKRLVLPAKLSARKELRKRIKEFLSCFPSKKGKILLIWATYLPNIYELVHIIYGTLSGVNKKYEVK